MKVAALHPRVRELRRDRLGAGVLRAGRERGGGVRDHGRRLGAGDHPVRHGGRVRRRPERDLDRAVDGRPGHRPALTTKVFHSVVGDPSDRGLSRERILRQIDGSLERLGIERVDTYMIHEPDPETPVAETARRARRAPRRRQGRRDRREQRRPRLARGGAGRRAGVGRAELLLAARSGGREGGSSVLRGAGDRVHRLRTARGRLAGREVPTRRAAARGIADDAAARSRTRTSTTTRSTTGSSGFAERRDRARGRHADAGASPGSSPTRASRASSSGRGAPSTSIRRWRRSTSRSPTPSAMN